MIRRSRQLRYRETASWARAIGLTVSVALHAALLALLLMLPASRETIERFKRVLETGETERAQERPKGAADVSVRTQEPVEPVNREVDPGLRF